MAQPRFNSVVLTWRIPEKTHGVIMGYRVTYSVDGKRSTANVVVKDYQHLNATFTIPSLAPMTRVSSISVAAYNGIGGGPVVTLPEVMTLEGIVVTCIPW